MSNESKLKLRDFIPIKGIIDYSRRCDKVFEESSLSESDLEKCINFNVPLLGIYNTALIIPTVITVYNLCNYFLR